MQGIARKPIHQDTGNPSSTKTGTASKQIKIVTKILDIKGHKEKSKSHGNAIGSTVWKEKLAKSVSKGLINDSLSKSLIGKTALHKTKFYKKQHSSSLQFENPSLNGSKEQAKEDGKSQKVRKRRKQRRQRKQRDNAERDDTSRLQRRTRYLFVKMKLEQNLIDAYSGDGWKGQSREKIRPEKELQRAKKEILKCKLGIRDAIHQLELLSSAGCIEDSVIAPDGSVHHEHIICAKCKLREAFPDNDIILCDGTCNCAFHQKCLDPPLLTENIPPGDQGWLCKFCDCKMEIIEAMNAHLGTHYSTDSHWQDIFKDEAALSDGGGASQDPEQEWPSDDSEDDDYDPEKNENSCSYSRAGSEADATDDASSSSSLWSLEDEVFSESGSPGKGRWNASFTASIGADCAETADHEILSGPRERRAVDYTKLYHEMFGKDAPVSEQISDDEDWGPGKRKRREKESDAASTLMTLFKSEKKFPNMNTVECKETLPHSGKTKRPFFRIPPDALEKLRLVFAENELPSKAVKDNLSKQLGLDSEKVNKWFKNARYHALKARKLPGEEPKQIGSISPKFTKESRFKLGEDKATAGPIASKDKLSATVVHSPKPVEIVYRRKNMQFLSSPLKKKQYKRALLNSEKAGMECGDDVSLKVLKTIAKKKKKRVNFKAGGGSQEAEAELERLCKMKGKVEEFKQILRELPNGKSRKANASSVNEHSVMYVPVAELREKR
ncbi:pathogenesis-related homeodomain protein isoform X1 [Rhododendron vialii]|uniref:pathogenesis-related homeodomain protein isoform X1 n=1 Tax=Rhododendron vialii TaxID=182163 RepID=UPI00265FCF33|nr:pathogenesis-related homeodomain protein isoform X1 [Rhododendron vialii]XP_058189289.1 pathogenesis-related homeodomain protein isoform X1 [Rhododendron vialii]